MQLPKTDCIFEIREKITPNKNTQKSENKQSKSLI